MSVSHTSLHLLPAPSPPLPPAVEVETDRQEQELPVLQGPVVVLRVPDPCNTRPNVARINPTNTPLLSKSSLHSLLEEAQ